MFWRFSFQRELLRWLKLTEIYKLRAHHGLCLSFFKGFGYSDDFTENMYNVKRMLNSNPLISITDEADIICVSCPNNKGGICISDTKVKEYDRKVMKFCNISKNEVLQFCDFEKTVYNNILQKGKRCEICNNCEWDKICR